MSKWRNVIRESVWIRDEYEIGFFTNELVPQSIVLQDRTESVISFTKPCQNGTILQSNFPPRAENENHMECRTCQGSISNCAFDYFKYSNKSVVKLFSI